MGSPYPYNSATWVEGLFLKMIMANWMSSKAMAKWVWLARWWGGGGGGGGGFVLFGVVGEFVGEGNGKLCEELCEDGNVMGESNGKTVVDVDGKVVGGREDGFILMQ